MSIRLGLVVGLLFAILVTYLASINPGRARLTLGGDWVVDVPLMGLVVGVFGAGAVLALVLGWLRDLTRSYARGPLTAAVPLAPLRADGAPLRAAEPAPARAGRDALIERRRFAEALVAQTQILAAVPREERAAEEATLAGLHYEIGRERLERGDLAGAVTHFKDALRMQPDFVPAALLLGETHLKASLYRNALDRHPDNLALAFGLGRVYFELAMLDEAAEQFQKMEVRAADLPLIHAYLGAILERRGQFRDAMEEYRRALRLSDSVQWPHHCGTCGALHPRWVDRCPSCRRWNTSRP